ncbi:uncharacterized protein [Mytilus edulis]|uniref:uncharacterized protein isoform X2 n=1 Tax=Mytilus edulis TaxID=6550 RepID=UPI0039EF8620
MFINLSFNHYSNMCISVNEIRMMNCIIHIYVLGNLFSQTYPSAYSTEGLNGIWTQHTTLQSTPYTTVFYVSEVNHTWDRTVDNCIDGWTLSGEKMFNSCRSESCQTINANKILPNVKKKPRFLWVDGYVVRSPVMEYYECLHLADLRNTVNALQFMKTLNHNGVEKCSLFCKQNEFLKDRDYILLQNDTCYCVRYTTLAQWNTQGKIQRVSTKSCDARCDGDKFDRCGGRKTLFSAYKLIGLPISDEIGGNCFFTVGTGRNSNRISCKERLSLKCEAVMTLDGSRMIDVKCVEIKMNWYDARKRCNMFKKYIQLFNNNCDNNQEIADKLWHNRFVKERIVWNADIPTDRYKTSGYSCLAMKLTEDSNYILTAQKCDKEYHSLCQKDVWDTVVIPKTNEQETEELKVSMFVGIAVALTVFLILLIVLVVCIRRHRFKVVVTEPAAISNSDDEYENVQENVNTDYHTLNLELVGETNDYSTLQPNVPDYIEIR